MEKNKNGNYEYKTSSGVFEWRSELEPRKASGFKDKRMVLVWLDIEDAQRLKAKIKSQAVTHTDLENDWLRFSGIPRPEVAKTDKSDLTDAVAVKVLKLLKTGKTAQEIEQLMRNGKEKFTDAQIHKYLPELKPASDEISF